MAKKIIIYSTPTCSHCIDAKNYLNDNKINFEEIDVAKDPAKAEEMIKKTGQMGVPVIIIGQGDEEKIIIGFDQEEVGKELGLK